MCVCVYKCVYVYKLVYVCPYVYACMCNRYACMNMCVFVYIRKVTQSDSSVVRAENVCVCMCVCV